MCTCLVLCSLCSSGLPLQSWVFTKGQGKGALTPSPASESPESTVIEVEDIPALLRDVARFAEAVEKLKDVVLAEGNVLPFLKKQQKKKKSCLQTSASNNLTHRNHPPGLGPKYLLSHLSLDPDVGGVWAFAILQLTEMFDLGLNQVV